MSFAIFIPLQNSFATANFGTEINVSDDTTESLSAKSSILGSNVYVVWQDDSSGEKEIFFKQSSDGGASFGSIINLSGTVGVDSTNPQISSSGTNVFVVWQEGSTGDVFFKTSSDSGINFSSSINLSNNIGNSILPQIATSGSNVYVVWQDDTDGDSDIFFTKSTGLFTTFDPPVNLSALQTDTSQNPQISVVGADVYIVWEDDTGGFFGNGDIFFVRSTTSGASFDTEVNLSSNFGDSAFPQVSSLGTNAFVLWQDQTTGFGDVYFARSIDEGSTFGSINNISDNPALSSRPQMTLSGTSVHVTWKDDTPVLGNGDILFKTSADSGANFGSEINLSGNSGVSDSPLISSSGNNLYVIWRDESFGTSPASDILLRSSSDSGITFSSFREVGSNTGLSVPSQVSASGSNVGVVFLNDESGDKDVFFRKGTTTPISITFDSSQYKIGNTPTLTVTDPSLINTVSGETVSINLKSDADPLGITLILTETGDTGVFSGSFTIIQNASTPGFLKTAPGNIITATLGSDSGSASIFPASLSLDFAGYDLGSIAHITVTDPNANTNPLSAQSVQVKVTSDADPTGIQLTLFETGLDTGIFTGNSALGNSDTDLIFMLGNDILSIEDQAVITSVDPAYNPDPGAIDFLPVTITSTTSLAVEGTGITLGLMETGVDTSEFSATLKFSSIASDAPTGTLLASGGDILSVIDPAFEFISNGLIIPNPDPSNGAIRTLLPGNVTASYQTISSTVLVLDQGQSGGGGGGLTRPGLVVNALSGLGGSGEASAPQLSLNNLIQNKLIDASPEIKKIVSSQDPTIPIKPMSLDSFNHFDFPLVINDAGFLLGGFSNTIQTVSLNVNEPVEMKFTFYEPEKIQHFSLYTNLRAEKTTIPQSNAQILYNDGKPLKLIDPEGLFDSVNVKIKNDGPLKKLILVEITFAKPMDTSDIIVRSWDPSLNSIDTYILDAIKVMPATSDSTVTLTPATPPTSDLSKISPTIIPSETTPTADQAESQIIPSWIKNNASWWSKDQIGDKDFVSGIEYLINNKIINIPSTGLVNSSVKEIPTWIQNTAAWWSEDQITDNEFTKAMEWLVNNGIIQVQL